LDRIILHLGLHILLPRLHKTGCTARLDYLLGAASEMTYIVSGGALYSAHLSAGYWWVGPCKNPKNVFLWRKTFFFFWWVHCYI